MSVHHRRSVLLLLILGFCSSSGAFAAQHYNEQDQLGYRCSSTRANCSAQAVYRVKQGQSIHDIATQFNTTIEQIQNATNFSATDASANRLLLIPINCSCSASTNRSSALVDYILGHRNTFWQIATESFEGLTTHQALEAENPRANITRLSPKSKLQVPIRCACPEEDQIRLLVTYVLGARDTSVAVVSRELGVTEADVVRANGLQGDPNMMLQERTTLLIPLKNDSRLVLPVPVPRSECPCNPVGTNGTRSGTRSSSRATWRFYFVLILIVGPIILLLLLILKKKQKQKHSSSTIGSNLIKASSTEMIMDSDKPTWYSLQEIEQATGYFDPACHIQGAVYAGILRGTKVAIKRIDAAADSRELSILCRVHHTNLVMLVGACQEAGHPTYIAYEYAEKGSLARWLHSNSNSGSVWDSVSFSDSVPETLTWTTRLQIALDVATGLEYLHNYTKPGFVHKDITSSNILLDAGFHAKIANFGMAKASTDSRTQQPIVVGTQGYMSPEYLSDGAASSKVDVYAFGVVLLELLTGLKPIVEHSGRPTCLSTVICPVLDASSSSQELGKWVDPVFKQEDYPKDSALALARLARLCLQDDAQLRPTMRQCLVCCFKVSFFLTGSARRSSVAQGKMPSLASTMYALCFKNTKCSFWAYATSMQLNSDHACGISTNICFASSS